MTVKDTEPKNAGHRIWIWTATIGIAILAFVSWWAARCYLVGGLDGIAEVGEMEETAISGEAEESTDDARTIHSGYNGNRIAADTNFRGPCNVQGLVLDKAGEPVEGARIETLRTDTVPDDTSEVETGLDPIWQEEEEISDLEGKFGFLVDSKCPNAVAATTRDWRRGECMTDYNERGLIECMIVVRQAWEIRGKVVDLDGQPIEGARVSTTPHWNAEQWLTISDPEGTEAEYDPGLGNFFVMWSQHGYTNGQGSFTVGPVNHDDWDLLVEKKGFQRTVGNQPAENLEKGTPVRLIVEPAECWTVLVLDSEDNPVPDSLVEVVPIVSRANLGFHESRTDADGRTEVCEVSGRNADIEVIPPGHTREFVKNRDQTDPLVVQAYPAGTVVGMAAMAPVETVFTTVVGSKDCVRFDGSVCDYFGHIECQPGPFRIDHIPAGEMTLRFACGSGMHERPVIIRAGEETDIGELFFE